MEMQLVYRSCYQGNLVCHNIIIGRYGDHYLAIIIGNNGDLI
jgi:hypothetical protein